MFVRLDMSSFSSQHSFGILVTSPWRTKTLDSYPDVSVECGKDCVTLSSLSLVSIRQWLWPKGLDSIPFKYGRLVQNTGHPNVRA